MSKDTSKLLIDEHPLQVLPTLACKIGLNGAIVLQQVHYWLGISKKAKDERKFKDGRWWVYNTYEEWQENFPWWSLPTIKRTILRLETNKILISREMDAQDWNHTKWYTIDYETLNGLIDCINVILSEDSDLDDGKPQVDPLLNRNTETTTKTTHKAGRLSEKEIQQANSEVDAIIAASKKVKYENRDKIPEQYLSLCDAYVELTGQKPTKRVLMDWFSTFSDWIGEGLQPKDIRAAYQHATRPDGGFLVGRPGSLTNTAVALRSKAQTSAPQIDESAVANTLDMIDEKFSGTYAPPPDWVREHVKVIAQRASINKKGIRR